MNTISFAMRYAKSHIKMYEDYAPTTFDIEEHLEAMDCLNCQAFLQCGIETYRWLIKADETLQRCILTEKIDYDPKIESKLNEFFRRWLVPCKVANQWIDEQYKRGYSIDNLEEFRACESEMQAIVDSFDEELVIPPVLEELRDQSLEEHRNGETAEFV